MMTVAWGGQMAGVVGRLLFGLAGLSARAAVVLALAAIIAVMLRRSSAAVRRWTWVVALAAVAVLPALSLLPAWHVSYLPAWQAWNASHSGAAGQTGSVAAAFYGAGPANWGASTALGQFGAWLSLYWLPLAVLLWLFVATLFAARLLAGCLRTYRLVSHAAPALHCQPLLGRVAAQAGVRRRVSLLFSENVDVPFTWGIVYPVVVLPAHAAEWDQDHIAAVIAHELGHVRSFDWLIQVAGEALRALHWFNPLVWFALRQLGEESERDCDNNALRYGAKPSLYAKHLMGIAGLDTMYYPHVAWSGHSGFYKRVRSILDPGVSRQPLPRLAGIAVTVVTLLAAVSVATMTGRSSHKASPAASGIAELHIPAPAMRERASAVKAASLARPAPAPAKGRLARKIATVKHTPSLRALSADRQALEREQSAATHRLGFQAGLPRPVTQAGDTVGVIFVVNQTSDGVETETLFFAVYRVIVPPLPIQGI